MQCFCYRFRCVSKHSCPNLALNPKCWSGVKGQAANVKFNLIPCLALASLIYIPCVIYWGTPQRPKSVLVLLKQQ